MCPNTTRFDEVDFSECRSEEVRSLVRIDFKGEVH